jgi:hypothetical protein
MDATMTKALRKVMAAFIEADGRPIVLHRPTFSRTGTGGYVKGAWQTLAPQTFRLVMYRRRLTDLTTPKADGEVPTLPYVLVGAFSSDVERMDEFSLDGVYYRIQGIEPHTNDRVHTDRVVAQLIALDQEGVTWV